MEMGTSNLTPTDSKVIPNLSISALTGSEGLPIKIIANREKESKNNRGSQRKTLSFLEAFHPWLLGLVDFRSSDQTQGQTSGK